VGGGLAFCHRLCARDPGLTFHWFLLDNEPPKFPRYFVEAIIFSGLDNVQPKFPRYFVEADIFSALDNKPPKFPRYFVKAITSHLNMLFCRSRYFFCAR
jgi:hypothetical protein